MTEAAEPFLSILLRPCGHGPEAAADTLLSLAAQTSDDFEVLVAPDDGGSTPSEWRTAVDAYHRSFARRVRWLEPSAATRTPLLAAAAAGANGRYLAAIDVPDVAFAMWVDSTARAAAEAPGAVVYSVLARQSFEIVDGVERTAYVSTARPRCLWSAEFDLVEYLAAAGSTPGIRAVSIPVAALEECVALFGEHADAIVDWIAVAVSAARFGVANSGEVTYLQRVVDGAEPVVDPTEAEWSAALVAVLGALEDFCVKVAGRTTSRLVADRREVERLRGALEASELQLARALAALADAIARLDDLERSTSWRLTAPVRTAGGMARRIRRPNP